MKKSLFLGYGVLAYMIFLGTFLYTIGFVSSLANFSLDNPPDVSTGYALVIDTLLFALFALQHTVMARPAFRRWWTRYIPAPIERSTFVLLSSLCLILLYWQWQPIGGTLWKIESETVKDILYSISMFGFWIVLISTFLIDHFELFGLRQVWYYFSGKTYKPVSFTTPLFYKYVRHPGDLGLIIALVSTPNMTGAHFFFALLTIGYILTTIQFEERDLMDAFGQQYRDYKRTAPMLIPFMKSDKDNEDDDDGLFTHI